MENFEEALVSWDTSPEPGEMVLLTDEDPLADGHALLLYLLAQALRNTKDNTPPPTTTTTTRSSIYCLGTAASESYYTTVLRKLGVDRARLQAPAFVYVSLIPPLDSSSASSSSSSSSSSSILDLAPILHNLMAFLDQQHQQEQQEKEEGVSSSSVMIVLDDLSLVEGIYGTRTAVELVQAIRGLLRNRGGKRQAQPSFLMRAFGKQQLEEDDDDNNKGNVSLPLLSLLLRSADTLLEIRPLTSGYSKDVHGLIKVRSRPGARAEVLNFKLVEGGIKCGRINAPKATSS